MGILDELMADKAWDPRWDGKPVFPQHNNPHLYLALVFKVLRQNGILYTPAWTFIQSCRNPKTGLLNRYPNGDGGQFSHDEAIGVLYYSSDDLTLDQLYGAYDNLGVGFQVGQLLCRMLPMMAFAHARLEGRVPFILRLAFAGYCLKHAFSSDDGAKAHIHIWLMSEEMHKYAVCREALLVWRGRKPPIADLLRKEPGGDWLPKYAKE